MYKKLILWVAGFFLIVNACVPSRKYSDLQTKYEDLEIENKQMNHRVKRASRKMEKRKTAYKKLEEDQKDLEKAYDKLLVERDGVNERYLRLEESYRVLERNSSKAIRENTDRNRKLLTEIEQKQGRLNEESAQLSKLTENLKKREERLSALETAIQDRKQKIETLKTEVAQALDDFDADAHKVNRKWGRIHISIKNEMLFDSTAVIINQHGYGAMRNLGAVLADKPDMQIWVGGFFDYDQLGNESLEAERDRSIKRALAVVDVLKENSALDPEHISVGGWKVSKKKHRDSTDEGVQIILSPNTSVHELTKELPE